MHNDNDSSVLTQPSTAMPTIMGSYPNQTKQVIAQNNIAQSANNQSSKKLNEMNSAQRISQSGNRARPVYARGNVGVASGVVGVAAVKNPKMSKAVAQSLN